MPDWFSRLRNVVWTSVAAVVIGASSVAAALFGASTDAVIALAGLGVALSVLSTRQ
jgi:hypothetical protein